MQGQNPGIAWRYALPKAASGPPPARPTHAWGTVQSPCSASCGGGRLLSPSHLPRPTLKQVLSPQASFNCVVRISSRTVFYGNHHCREQMLLYYLRISHAERDGFSEIQVSRNQDSKVIHQTLAGGKIQNLFIYKYKNSYMCLYVFKISQLTV